MAKKDPKTLTLHDYLVKYQVGLGILLTVGLAIWDKNLTGTQKDLEMAIKVANMQILISNNTDRIISIEHVVYKN